MKPITTFPTETTLENLKTRFSGSYEAAIRYGNYAVAAAYAWDNESRDMICIGAVYAFTTGDRSIEAPLALRKVSEISFPDAGHALEWGFNLAKLLTDVVAAFGKEG